MSSLLPTNGSLMQAEVPFEVYIESSGQTLTVVSTMSRYDMVRTLRQKLAKNLNLPNNTVVTAPLFCKGEPMEDNMALQNYDIPQSGTVVAIDEVWDLQGGLYSLTESRNLQAPTRGHEDADDEGLAATTVAPSYSYLPGHA